MDSRFAENSVVLIAGLHSIALFTLCAKCVREEANAIGWELCLEMLPQLKSAAKINSPETSSKSC